MNTPVSNNQERPRVAILGVTGMIGSAIYGALRDSCELVVTYRDPNKLTRLLTRYGRSDGLQKIGFDFSILEEDYRQGFAGETIGPNLQKLLSQIGQVDWVINAMGITKALANVSPSLTLFINGAVPHILAAYFGDRLVHLTTDCVFDGAAGAPYDEASPKRPVDLYGLSKAVGEPSSALVIRCSTIGPELGTSYGLLEWFAGQTGSVRGFTNHLWNGLTTAEIGQICLKLVHGTVMHPGPGSYHIFSDDITKSDLLVKFRDRYNLDTIIDPQPAVVGIDRRLASHYDFCSQLNVPSLDKMVAELPEIKAGLLQAE